MIGAFQFGAFQFTGFQEASVAGSGGARLWHSMLFELRRRKRLEEEEEERKRREEAEPVVTVSEPRRAPLRLVPIAARLPQVQLQAMLQTIDLAKVAQAKRERDDFEAFGRFMLEIAKAA